MNTTTRRAATSAVLAAGLALGTAAAAHAAQQYVPLNCDNGDSITVRVALAQAETSWSAGQIVDGGSGTLIPMSFSYAFTPTGEDKVTQTVVKGQGHAGPKDPVVTCTSTQVMPEGTFTLTVIAVARP
jgi:hypothetical protein